MLMKKTLIALAVAGSVVSGSAFAWSQDGINSQITLGGTLNQSSDSLVWEAMAGTDVSNLDGKILKGATVAKVDVENSILALSVRPSEKRAFTGRAGISPRIDFGGKVDFSNAVAGKGVMTLPVTGSDGSVIGKAVAPFAAAGWGSVVSSDRKGVVSLYAVDEKDGFFGGLPNDWEKTAKEGAKSIVESLAPDALDHFDAQGLAYDADIRAHYWFDEAVNTYSAAYASGILKGDTIEIKLNKPATGGEPIAWKGVLPVTLSFN
ncbi:TPA: fimbrial protein [Escherichia coli]|nr:fimbrial protein [Escherichia coli]HAW2392793.1 fimbrial protein [Escherichia coli]